MKLINSLKTDKIFNTNYKDNKYTLYLPLIICGGFFLITILLFASNIYDWHLTNPLKLYSFLISCLVALCLGYWLCMKKSNKQIAQKKLTLDLNKIIYISFGINLVTILASVYANTGSIYINVIRGITDSGAAYRASHSIASSFSTIITYISIILGPIIGVMIPIIYIYFKSLSKQAKTLGILIIILNLAIGMSQGIINSFATFAFQISLFLILYLFSIINGKSKKEKKEKILVICIIIFTFVSFITYYKIVMSNRLVADSQVKISNKKDTSKPQIEIKPTETVDEKKIDSLFNGSAQFEKATLQEKSIISILPDSIEASTSHLISYITHGYKGLSLAMEEDFTSSYGLGFSDFFRHNFLKVIGKSDLEASIYDRTYMDKIADNGWITGAVWSTFFVYPASDIGFPLTIVLVFGIGYLFALLWKDTLKNKNIFASVLFVNICIMICFFSANNLLFQTGTCFSIIIWSTLWILSKINFKLKKGK